MNSSESTRPPTKPHTVPGKRIGRRHYVHILTLPSLGAATEEQVNRACEISGLEPGKDFNVVRRHEASARLSLLNYPGFFEDPFPALLRSWTVDLETATFAHRTYEDSLNPPILHRKELLLPENHPDVPRFAELTTTAETLGLFEQPSRIGFLKQWEKLVESSGFRLEGHEFLPIGNREAGSDAQEPSTPSDIVLRHRTALSRTGFSAPVQLLVRHGLLSQSATFFDYGCGRGDDVAGLASEGITAQGWDPHYQPNNPRLAADIVNLGFVINVIEDFDERVAAAQQAFALAGQLLAVSVMPAAAQPSTGRPFNDGLLTGIGTFQRYYTQNELCSFLEGCLEELPIPVAPGIAYVFSDPLLERQFLRGRSRSSRRPLPHFKRLRATPNERRTTRSVQLYADHQALLDRLWTDSLALGRPPFEDELSYLNEVVACLGSVRRAISILKKNKDPEELGYAGAAKKDDLLVHRATTLLETRRARAPVPDDERRELRHFFGTLQEARRQAHQLLYAVADSTQLESSATAAAERGLGWLEPEESFQFHASALDRLPAPLRVYVTCAAILYGDPRDADLLKIHLNSGKVTLMKFDCFDGNPLPRMLERVKVRLRDQELEHYVYGDEFPAPYLYLKSQYIDEEHPDFPLQVAFDQQLQDLGLFDFSGRGPDPAVFRQTLTQARWEVDGHVLRRSQDIPSLDNACGQYLIYRDLIECGETQKATQIPNLPANTETYAALLDLTSNILDPVIEYFGMIRLTYGFCSAELGRKIKARVAPKLDQHSAHERNRRGRYICERLGAAVDFIVDDEDMEEVAQWIVDNTPFDRLYFYGRDRPIHVSYSPTPTRQFVEMRPTGRSGRLVPRVRK